MVGQHSAVVVFDDPIQQDAVWTCQAFRSFDNGQIPDRGGIPVIVTVVGPFAAITLTALKLHFALVIDDVMLAFDSEAHHGGELWIGIDQFQQHHSAFRNGTVGGYGRAGAEVVVGVGPDVVGDNHLRGEIITKQMLLHVRIAPADPGEHTARIVPFTLVCVVIGENVALNHTLAAPAKLAVLVGRIEVEDRVCIEPFHIEERINVAGGQVAGIQKRFDGKVVRRLKPGTAAKRVLVVSGNIASRFSMTSFKTVQCCASSCNQRFPCQFPGHRPFRRCR